jgi:hypothetical protein
MALVVAPSKKTAPEVQIDQRGIMLAIAPQLKRATEEIVETAAEHIRQAISVPVEYASGGVVIRSQPGEPPREETGSMGLGIDHEVATDDNGLPMGWVTAQRSAADGDEDAARVLEEGGLNGQGHYIAPRPYMLPEAEEMKAYAPGIVAKHLSSDR